MCLKCHDTMELLRMRNPVLAPILFFFFLLFLLSIPGARAQERRLEVGGHVATTLQHELDTTDVGFGARLGFRASSLIGIEGEVSFYPTDAPETVTLSTSRLEGLFGVKIGPRFDRFSVFGKVRPGFMRFAEAPGPVACILIYPPPLGCVLAGGATVLALDLGGGVELYPTKRSIVRVDVSDLLLRYPGPAFTRDGDAVTDGRFWRGNLRLTFGAGIRF
jgi:Outer membrane protein beta-barrel domain